MEVRIFGLGEDVAKKIRKALESELNREFGFEVEEKCLNKLFRLFPDIQQTVMEAIDKKADDVLDDIATRIRIAFEDVLRWRREEVMPEDVGDHPVLGKFSDGEKSVIVEADTEKGFNYFWVKAIEVWLTDSC